MRWIAKAALQRGIGVLPRADSINYWFQARVTRGLPRDDSSFRLHVDTTLDHLQLFKRHTGRDPVTSHFYEFGTGWDLITPLLFAMLGVQRQTLVDIRPNLRFELVADSAGRLERLRPEIESTTGAKLRALPSVDDRRQLQALGIEYLAPCDARRTGLPSDSVDFISSTFTLEHIPAEDIAAILTESGRLLRPGGVMSSAIDLQDHYSYFDSSITPYNFLKFNDRTWRLVNSPMHYQNRLRLSEYERLFRDAGLVPKERTPIGPTPAELATVDSLELAPRFQFWPDREDLAVRGVTLVTAAATPDQ